MATNMRHVVQLVLPLTQFVATFSRQLSWSGFVNLLPLNSLDKHERQPGAEAPIGLTFVRRIQPRTSGAAANAQRRHHRGRVPDRTTPKAEPKQKLHAALLERGCCW